MMKSTTPKEAKKIMVEEKQAGQYRYLDDLVKNYQFADWVKVRSGPLGMLFSFGKSHPDKEEFIIFSEILLPIQVAHSLGQIIKGQLEQLQEKGFIKIEIEGEDKNA